MHVIQESGKKTLFFPLKSADIRRVKKSAVELKDAKSALGWKI